MHDGHDIQCQFLKQVRFYFWMTVCSLLAFISALNFHLTLSALSFQRQALCLPCPCGIHCDWRGYTDQCQTTNRLTVPRIYFIQLRFCLNKLVNGELVSTIHIFNPGQVGQVSIIKFIKQISHFYILNIKKLYKGMSNILSAICPLTLREVA